jgi:hypothetical protein
MDVFDEPIDADSYLVDSGSFKSVEREVQPVRGN